MRQTKVLNAEPAVKLGEVKTQQGTVPAMIVCFHDHDANEMLEFPLVGPLAKAYQEMINSVIEEMPELPPDLVIASGTISEDDLAQMAAVTSGKPPPGS